MKRLVMVAILLFMATIQLMGQTTPTAKTVAPASPAANSSAKSASKPEPKHVIYWDGTGRWEPAEGDVRAGKRGAPGAEKWPSEVYMTPAEERDERSRESEGSSQLMNSTSERAPYQNSHEPLRCMGPERHPCSEGVVRELSRRMEERRAEHPLLASIRALTLESPDGTVSCRRHDGQACTREELRSLNEHVAEPLRCRIYYGASTSYAESHTSTVPYQTTTTPTTTYAPTNKTSMPPSTTPATTGGTTTTRSTTAATPNNPNHTAMTQNHGPAAGYHPSAWQNRTATTQNHASGTGYHSTPAKPE